MVQAIPLGVSSPRLPDYCPPPDTPAAWRPPPRAALGISPVPAQGLADWVLGDVK